MKKYIYSMFIGLTVTLSAGTIYTNNTLKTDSGAVFYVIEGGVKTTIPKTHGFTSNTVQLITGKVWYKAAPWMSHNAPSWVKYKTKSNYGDNKTISGYGTQRLGKNNPAGCEDNPHSCGDKFVPPETIETRDNGYIHAYGLNGEGSHSVSSAGIYQIYSFAWPTSSPDQCSGSDNHCVADKLAHLFNTTATLVELGMGVKMDADGADTSDEFQKSSKTIVNKPIKKLEFSNRVKVNRNLSCPKDFKDASGDVVWDAEKYNGSSRGYRLVNNIYNKSDSEFAYVPSDQSIKLHDSLYEGIDQAYFSSVTPIYTESYAGTDYETQKICERKLCPVRYTEKTEDTCQATVSRMRIKEIPKTLYLVYPNDNITEMVYEVPNIKSYFNPANGGVGAEYSVTYEGTGISTEFVGNKLIIKVVKDGAIRAKMLDNKPYKTYILLLATEPLKLGSYIYPNKKFGLQLKIDISILSPIYASTSNQKELYRCQALTK